METRERNRGIVGPFILIGLGVLFLLGNLGLIGWSVWEVILRFWPVVLIALGLEVLIGRRSLVGSLIVLAVVIGMVGALLVFAPAQTVVSTETTSISQPLDGAGSASVDISFGAAAVRVDALADPGLLVQGTVAADPGQQITQTFQVADGIARYRLGTRSTNSNPFTFRMGGDRQGWNLFLNKEIPISLRLNGGIGEAELNLSELRISDLDANLGVGKTTITLPARGQSQARINGGVGEVIVVMPPGAAARIQADSGLGAVNVPDGYQKEGNVYTTPGYETAGNRIDLRIKGGVGSVSIR